MREHVKWASGSAARHEETIGPRHDPYGRTTIEIRKGDHTYELVTCGLAGEYLKRDGKEILKLDEPFVNRGTLEERRRADLERLRAYNEAVAAETGFEPYYWNYRLWVRLCEARHRRDPENAWLYYNDPMGEASDYV